MKTRLLIVSVMCLSSLALIPYSDASRSIMSIEEMAQRSDAIAIGTVQSTWIDIRLFDKHPIVDTAKINVDEWLKNDKNAETLEIRYYGYWAKTIDDLRGVSISGTPVHHYESGQKVMLILDHEEDTAVMGGGYYSIFEGSYIITEDIAVSQSGEKTLLQELQNTINSNLNSKSDVVNTDAKDDAVPAESGVRFCAYIGFEKYPENLFAEFLQNPYNQDVTFLNFTDADLRQIPEFYELILESNPIEYPLNDRVRFAVSPEEYRVIKNHFEQRAHYEFDKDGETMLNQNGGRDSVGNYRTPQILMDGKLYGTHGLNAQVFSDRDVNMNIEYNGTLEEAKKRLVENTNPNRANLIYFEIEDDDKIPLARILDAISDIHKSKDKIRMSEDVGSGIQGKTQNFFLKQNKIQFDDNESQYTHYFIFNGTMYETSFVIC